jgi:hypothetical protein
MAKTLKSAETTQDRADKLNRKRVRELARDHNMTVAEVEQALLQHPINSEPGNYLRRVLALELVELDALEQTFRNKAIADSDPACGQLVVKIKERRATLLGLNPPQGHAVQIVSQPGKFRDRESSLAALDRALAFVATQGPAPELEPPDDDTTNAAGTERVHVHVNEPGSRRGR